jgi:hypothetical protein
MSAPSFADILLAARSGGTLVKYAKNVCPVSTVALGEDLGPRFFCPLCGRWLPLMSFSVPCSVIWYYF